VIIALVVSIIIAAILLGILIKPKTKTTLPSSKLKLIVAVE